MSNTAATMAMPLETIRRHPRFPGDEPDVERVLEIIDDNEIVEVVVGLPRTLKGRGSSSVDHAYTFARRLAESLNSSSNGVPVRFVDERLSTVVATQALHAAGRTAKNMRGVVDQAAAVEILQSWLDGRAIALTQRAEAARNEQ